VQVGGLNSQNASTDQHQQARDRLSRALFATQSATQFDLHEVIARPVQTLLGCLSAGGRERADACAHR
jgi:hypothetical protein